MTRFLVLAIWFLLTVLLKIPSRSTFLITLIIILISVFVSFLERSGLALRLMTYAYGFAVIGAVSLLREIRKDV